MNILTKVGKVIFALVFVVFGVLHFLNAEGMAALVPAFIPGGVLWVYLTAIGFFAAAIAIVTGKYLKWAGILLAVELGSFVLTIHLPAVLSGNMMAMSQLLKDAGLAAAALVIAGLDRA